MKMRIAGTISMLAATLVAGCASVEQKAASLDAELDSITRWWPGQFAGEAALPGTGESQAIFHEIASIQAPQFGDRVYAYQLRRDGFDGPILQQKIFSFDTDPLRERNRMRAWVFAPDQLDPALNRRPSTWGSLRSGQLMSFPDECAFRWRATKTGFTGIVSAEDCEFDSRAFGQRIRPDMSYEIAANSLVWNETLSGADGNVLVTTGGSLRAERVGPVIDVRWSFYDVQGETVMDIRRDLYAKTPIEADGEPRDARTDWIVAWDIERSETDTSCSIANVTTTVEISYLLPRLTSRESLPAELGGEWDAYMAALLKHELRHQEFAVNAARKIESVLPGLAERATCDVVAEEAGRIAGNIVQSARRRERQYDYTTRHGYAEGAEFPSSRAPD